MPSWSCHASAIFVSTTQPLSTNPRHKPLCGGTKLTHFVLCIVVLNDTLSWVANPAWCSGWSACHNPQNLLWWQIWRSYFRSTRGFAPCLRWHSRLPYRLYVCNLDSWGHGILPRRCSATCVVWAWFLVLWVGPISMVRNCYLLDINVFSLRKTKPIADEMPYLLDLFFQHYRLGC